MKTGGEQGLKLGGGSWIVLSSLVWLIDCLVSLFFLFSFQYSFHLPGSAIVHNASGTTQFLWGDVCGRISWTEAVLLPKAL